MPEKLILFFEIFSFSCGTTNVLTIILWDHSNVNPNILTQMLYNPFKITIKIKKGDIVTEEKEFKIVPIQTTVVRKTLEFDTFFEAFDYCVKNHQDSFRIFEVLKSKDVEKLFVSDSHDLIHDLGWVTRALAVWKDTNDLSEEEFEELFKIVIDINFAEIRSAFSAKRENL